MTRLEKLTQTVDQLYTQKLPKREEWADWLHENHVHVVTNNAKILAEKYGADPDLAQAAALLHDVADYKMARNNPQHEAESLATARDVLKDCGYTAEEIALVVDDAIRYHSCHGDERPKSKEGLVLATADALAHFKTDWYVYTTRILGQRLSLAEIKEWTLKKIDRDLFNKISFEDERKSAQHDYDLIKELFSR